VNRAGGLRLSVSVATFVAESTILLSRWEPQLSMDEVRHTSGALAEPLFAAWEE